MSYPLTFIHLSRTFKTVLDLNFTLLPVPSKFKDINKETPSADLTVKDVFMMERLVPHNHVVQIDQPGDHKNSNDTKSAFHKKHSGSVTIASTQPATHPNHLAMFARKLDNDPFRENMVISIVSIFFCCCIGLMATFKASEASVTLSIVNNLIT
ncbi:hypothetical protein RRG08_066172 [Elysia crispata]|uniref:Uncharacterized protein n=1 Tax=Elysia crispata TaxID=231223 RepID=A0AAE0YLQ7_9GAST|nr:hypothetical protein RRG08_066172 [Elysia crispata]